MRNRKKTRLKDYDYSKAGCYFVTICSHNRINHFGEIRNSEMILNHYGKIVSIQWEWLAGQYSYIILDEFVIMPNHFHGILAITEPDNRNGHDRSLQKIKSLSSLIGAIKTTSSKQIRLAGDHEFQWQKSFHDRIIRNEKEFENIQAYIHYNPLKWEWDIENKINENNDREKYYKNIILGDNKK